MAHRGHGDAGPCATKFWAKPTGYKQPMGTAAARPGREGRGRARVVRLAAISPLHDTAYLVVEYGDGLPLSQAHRERESAGRPFMESDLLATEPPKCDCTSAAARIAWRRSWRGHRRVWSTARRSVL